MSSPRLPLPARVVNRLGRRVAGRIPLAPARLIRAAERRAGLNDWGDDWNPEVLERLIDSVEGDVRPHALGRLLIREQLVANLTTRLRLVDARRSMPEALRIPPASPLIIAAMPRTGTTVLHRLLCLDPDAMWLPLWAGLEPLPVPSPREWRRGGARLARARAGSAALRWLLPDVHHKHGSLAHEPEECVWLFMPTLVSLQFWALWPVLDYARWAADADTTQAYLQYREQLQLLQTTHPGKRWVLKSPMHFLSLDTLLETMPEARVVLLHRDPAEVLPSLMSLFATTQRLTTDRWDREVGVALTTEVMADRAARAVELRDGVHSDRFMDVAYADLVADPVGTARRVQEWAGHAWSPQLDAAAREWVDAHPQHAHGRHRYSLADHGLDEQRIAEAFAPYLRRFL